MENQSNINQEQNSEGLNIKDFAYLCVAKWYWFAAAIVVAVCVAVAYLLFTPPVYTRSASILIKEDDQGSIGGGASDLLGDFDLFSTKANVNNEMQSIGSPAVMLDVVRRLGLDVNYHTDGQFYRKVLYGSLCPYEVAFVDMQDNESASFTIYPDGQGRVKLSDFVRGDNDSAEDVEMAAALGDTTSTPIGRMVIKPSAQNDTATYHAPVYISRKGLVATTKAYSANLSVMLGDEKSTIINLSFKDVCTQRAEDVLNTVIAVYNENWIKDKNQVAVSTSMFINERLGVIERELGNVDESISSYKSENLLPDVQAAASMYMEQSSETSAQILALNTQLSMARYIRNYLTGSVADNQLIPANSGIESQGIEKQISEYNTMQLRRNDLVANSSEKNPLAVDMDRSLRNMRSAIVTSIDNHIATLTTQIGNLQQSERQTTQRIAANPSQGKYLLSVERQQKVKEALYLFLLQKREENELSQAFTAYNTRVITPPYGDLEPTAPAKVNILLAAIVLGLCIPLALIFVRESLNTRLRGRKDLERLTVPFAGEVPLAAGGGKKNTNDGRVVIRAGKRDVVNEAFRVLRTNMEFMLDDKLSTGRAPVVLFTSFNPGSGKTFIAVNAAASFAIKGKRVLVVDGDMRRGSASAYVDSPSKGMSDYLAHRADDVAALVVEMPGYENLHLLPVGTIPPNPTELLASPRFKDLIDYAASEYDYVFIDCPPIEIVADTQIIGKLADRTIFIVRAGLLERDMLPELQRIYDENRLNNMAVVLNGTTSSRNSHYGYKYGYHYGYGSNYYDK